MIRKATYPILCFLFISLQALVAQNVVSVDPVTGTANVSIPVYSLSRGSVSLPIGLIYSATGVKPKDVENNAGMGWSFQCGGQISRQLRGLPDDIKYDVALQARSGWLYNTNGSTISGYTLNNNGSTCSYETIDIGNISNNFGNLSDTEPDIFNVSAPGLSCQLVLDGNHVFHPLSYQDLVITYTYDNSTGTITSGNITSFTITNDKGIKYTFGFLGAYERAQRATISSSASTIAYLKNDYNLYQDAVQYNDNWHLTSMIDANGNGVSFTYTTGTIRNSADTVVLYQGGASGATTAIRPYIINSSITPQLLHYVYTVDNDVTSAVLTFTWGVNLAGVGEYGTGQSMISTVTGMGKTLTFGYRTLGFVRGSHTYNRYFLDSYQDVGSDYGCSSPVQYNFSYVGETKGTPYSTTTLSDSTSTQIDYWGYMNRNVSSSLLPQLYVNPSNGNFPRYSVYSAAAVGADYTNTLSGTSRFPDVVSYVSAGSLSQISYLSGGWTTLVYEPNDYLDVPSNTTLQGGGIRIKQIIDSVGTGSTNNLIRNYTYTLPGGSVSSGKPISMPVFAFTTPYTGTATGNDYWNYATIRSSIDLSTADHSIMYGYVRESQSGAGSTLYQYYIPATTWDVSATPACTSCAADWSPTINYIGRTNCSNSYGPVKNDYNTYPFTPNINYDAERGMLQKATSYNEAGTEVSESNYTYQRTGTPTVISGLKFDYNGGTSGVLGYAKYKVYADAKELTASVIKKVYNSGSLSVAQQSTTNYSYGSTYHRLAQTTTTNSDGSTLISNIKYAKDYAVSSGASNANVAAIYSLQQLNVNTPIETYSQVQRGSAVVTTAANLTLFSPAVTSQGTYTLPSQLFKFTSPNGVTDFSPFTITSGTTLSKDSRYINSANFTLYDFTALPETSDDGFKHQKTVFVDHNTYNPEVTFTDVAATEVGFNDFDSALVGAGFSLSGTQTPVTTGHTGQGMSFGTAQNFSRTIIKNARAKNYLFSAWINATGTGTITITLTNGGTSNAYSITYGNTGGAWKYYQLPVALTGMSAATFTATVTTSANISIDDILFYPDNSQVHTYSYDAVTHYKTSETNTNGVSAYYKYDEWGRLLFQYDQDKNIVAKNVYVNLKNVTDFAPSIGTPSAVNTSIAATFTGFGGDACTSAGNTYSWQFDSGSFTTPSSSNTIAQTFSTTGTHTAVLTVNSPYFGSKTTAPSSFTVTNAGPALIPLSYNNYTTANGNISSVVFYQGSTQVYSFTAAQLSTASVLQGSYTIYVYFSGGAQYNATTGTGYSSVLINGGNCQSFSSAKNSSYYTFTQDLSTATSVNFMVSQYTCDYYAQ